MDKSRSGRFGKAQAALDFLISYGVVILAIAVTLVVLFALNVNGSYTESPYCTPGAGFSCGFFAINSITGVLQIQLAQATGSQVTISGIACAAVANSIGNTPGEGNIYVTGNYMYYPGGHFANSILYSGASNTFSLNCYGPSGIATGALGSAYSGYVWLNYTSPGYGVPQTEQVATVNAKYT